MEEGIFDFQPDTYIRAFLKEYARCINENEDKLLSDYGRAKGGFYTRKKQISEIKEQPSISIKPVETPGIKSQKPKQNIEDEIDEEFRKKAPPKRKEIYTGPDPDQEMLERESRRRYTKWSKKRKIVTAIIVFVCLVIIAAWYKFLNNTNNHTSNIKQKSFSEISEDYENQIKSKTDDSSRIKKDSTQVVSKDSLLLTIKATKEVRVKVFVDEKKTVDEVIQPKDSLKITAKQQFRFSASANASIELILNGKPLKKPASINTPYIKDLVINKDGIVSQ